MNKIRLVGILMAVAAAITSGGPEQASAQTVDLSGAWTLSVTSDVDGAVTTPALTLEQDGETLTGHYSSEALGEEDVTGTVSGSEFTISFSADLGGQMAPVTYRGTIDDDGNMTGTLDIADGLFTATFTATRSEG